MRGLAAGEEGFKDYPKILAENFVFLNVYCKSVTDEDAPRGPDGPFQFKDRSVPVYLIKSFEGKTYTQQLGFVADQKVGMRNLVRDIDRALKENGPVLPPKMLRPLFKDFAKGEEYLAKDRPGYAWAEFEKVVKAGQDAKKFAEGPPAVAQRAAAAMKTIVAEAAAQLDEAEKAEDPKERQRIAREILRSHGKIPEIADRARTLAKAE